MQIDSSVSIAALASSPTVAVAATANAKSTRPQGMPAEEAVDKSSPLVVPEQVEDTETAVDSFNKVAEPLGVSLKFSRDENSGKVIIEMLDQTTGETLRQIPDKAALRLSEMLGKLQGAILDRRM